MDIFGYLDLALLEGLIDGRDVATSILNNSTSGTVVLLVPEFLNIVDRTVELLGNPFF